MTQKNDVLQTVLFEAGGEHYGVDVLRLEEIVPIMELDFIPQAPPFLEGMINLRGEAVPVVDLAKLFGQGREGYYGHTRILIASVEGRRIGFIADGVHRIQSFSPEDVQPSLVENPALPFIRGIGKLASGALVQLLFLDRLLQENQLQQMSRWDIEHVRPLA